MTKQLDFFLFLGSTYTYLAVNRADEVAAAHGVTFGSPTFADGSEIFWGDDRLEDAIAWCTSHQPM